MTDGEFVPVSPLDPRILSMGFKKIHRQTPTARGTESWWEGFIALEFQVYGPAPSAENVGIEIYGTEPGQSPVDASTGLCCVGGADWASLAGWIDCCQSPQKPWVPEDGWVSPSIADGRMFVTETGKRYVVMFSQGKIPDRFSMVLRATASKDSVA